MRAPLYKRFQEVLATDQDTGHVFEGFIVAIHKRYILANEKGEVRRPAQMLPDFAFDTFPHEYEIKGPNLIVHQAEYQMTVGDRIAVYTTPRYFLHWGYIYRVAAWLDEDAERNGGLYGLFDEEYISIQIKNNASHEKSNPDHSTLLLPS